MESGVTLVRSNSIVCAADADGNQEVDLGLGSDEAARILGCSLNIVHTAVFVANTVFGGYAAYSFDPEDTVPEYGDDDHFAWLQINQLAILASVGCVNAGGSIVYDFSGMNLISARNVSMVFHASSLGGRCIGRIFYEKYHPNSNELVQLIAQRR